MNTEKAPAETGAGKKNWQLVVDEPTADFVNALRNRQVAEPFRSILNSLAPIVKGSLAVELGLPNRIEDAEGE